MVYGPQLPVQFVQSEGFSGWFCCSLLAVKMCRRNDKSVSEDPKRQKRRPCTPVHMQNHSLIGCSGFCMFLQTGWCFVFFLPELLAYVDANWAR